MTEVVAPPDEPIVEEAPVVPTRRLLVFVAGGMPVAAEMDSVREIVPSLPVTRLPGAPATVSGLINLRGTVVTVLDAGTYLGESPWRRWGGLILLAGYGERLIGVGIDDVRDIYDAPEDQFGPAPADAPPGVSGVVVIANEQALLLDVQAIMREVLGQREGG
jgi:purine-binding chemotaxis protein CheW